MRGRDGPFLYSALAQLSGPQAFAAPIGLLRFVHPHARATYHEARSATAELLNGPTPGRRMALHRLAEKAFSAAHEFEIRRDQVGDQHPRSVLHFDYSPGLYYHGTKLEDRSLMYTECHVLGGSPRLLHG